MPRTRRGAGSMLGPPPSLQQYVEEFCDAPLERGAVIQLSKTLARVVGEQLRVLLADVKLEVGRRTFAGSSRRHHLDVFAYSLDKGLQLGVDVKGLNSGPSVGKNWNNRIGDLHELAANHHATSPKAVLGGVLAIPLEDITPTTLANIERAMLNLGGRTAVGDTSNLLECACLIVISKEERRIHEALPEPTSPLHVQNFATAMARLYKQRWV